MTFGEVPVGYIFGSTYLYLGNNKTLNFNHSRGVTVGALYGTPKARLDTKYWEPYQLIPGVLL